MGVKATFMLDEQIMDQARYMVRQKRFKSMNAFVEQAMKDELARLREEEIRTALLEAGRDPLVLADVREAMSEFAASDFERAGE